MSRWFAALVTVALAVGACTGSPRLEPEAVAGAEDCDDLVPLGAELVRRMMIAVEGAPLGVVTGEAPADTELEVLRAIGRDLDLRAARLGCDPAALNGAIIAEIGDLSSEDPVATVFLDIVREGVVGPLPSVPSTTVSPPAG